MIAKSGWQSAEEQVTEPILVVSVGGSQSLNVTAFSQQHVQTQCLSTERSFSLNGEISLAYGDLTFIGTNNKIPAEVCLEA